MKEVKRRDFLKKTTLAAGAPAFLMGYTSEAKEQPVKKESEKTEKSVSNATDRKFNGPYTEPCLDRIAFPIGGFGTGMFCIEGSGCLSHFSLRHTPAFGNEPFMMGAISVKGMENGAKVLEGPVPGWKVFGKQGAGNGLGESSYGYPRFAVSSFEAKFPFGMVSLRDEAYPLEATIRAWNPFIPTDEDNSSLPVAALEYTFRNVSSERIEAVFSYHAFNFLRISTGWGKWEDGNSVGSVENGFVLSQDCRPGHPEYKSDFAIFSTRQDTVVDHSLFRGGWFDAKTVIWKDITECTLPNDPETKGANGASLYVPIVLGPGEETTVPLLFSWYVPHSTIRAGLGETEELKKLKAECQQSTGCCDDYSDFFYEPWYSKRFAGIGEVTDYWQNNYQILKEKTESFSDCFYGQSLPDEVMEAVAANLTILKSTTVLRQRDGKLWAYEGSGDDFGCCHGSCTHVWNYAQAISRLFPDLERTLRETELLISQNEEGHQTFRATLPLQEPSHDFHAAADGQLGGSMKVYREWRISGDTGWMKRLWPKVKKSMDYCIRAWDPKGKGVLEEPHHNTYDIEFWGPDGMCTSFYLGALSAIIIMGREVSADVSKYEQLLEKGTKYMESELYDGEYFIQKIVWKGLEAKDPTEEDPNKSLQLNYSDEARSLLMKEGPKYQYGQGCLSDGILGCWMANMCGLEDFLDKEKLKSHLLAVHKYNFKKDLSNHVNPQRPSFAMGKEGGVLLCTWPKGGKLTLPFVYSNEVWTGIEYQVASHLIAMGEVDKGLEIVREIRKRYDGRIRNPFNEYECGNWYARALASYGLIQSLTGVRYDAVDKVLFVDSKIGNNFRSFYSCASGFGTIGLENGDPFVKWELGDLDIKTCLVSGKKMKVKKL